MEHKAIMKLVVYTDEKVITMELEEQIELIKKAIEEKSFNHIELINPAKK